MVHRLLRPHITSYISTPRELSTTVQEIPHSTHTLSSQTHQRRNPARERYGDRKGLEPSMRPSYARLNSPTCQFSKSRRTTTYQEIYHIDPSTLPKPIQIQQQEPTAELSVATPYPASVRYRYECPCRHFVTRRYIANAMFVIIRPWLRRCCNAMMQPVPFSLSREHSKVIYSRFKRKLPTNEGWLRSHEVRSGGADQACGSDGRGWWGLCYTDVSNAIRVGGLSPASLEYCSTGLFAGL